MKLLAKLGETERMTARTVLDNWPKEPPNRELPALGKSSQRVAANAIRDLSREQAILRLVDSPDAMRVALQQDQVTVQAQKVRSAMRQQLAELYRSADPARQAFMGWAVDPDDVPAFPQAGTPGSPNPELVYQRNLEKEFHDWLATSRYSADAKLFGASPVKALQTAAVGYRDIARMYTEPLR
jgi:hypothetical protein